MADEMGMWRLKKIANKAMAGRVTMRKGVIYDPPGIVQHATNESALASFAKRRIVAELEKELAKRVHENEAAFRHRKMAFVDSLHITRGVEKSFSRFSGLIHYEPATHYRFSEFRVKKRAEAMGKMLGSLVDRFSLLRKTPFHSAERRPRDRFAEKQLPLEGDTDENIKCINRF